MDEARVRPIWFLVRSGRSKDLCLALILQLGFGSLLVLVIFRLFRVVLVLLEPFERSFEARVLGRPQGPVGFRLVEAKGDDCHEPVIRLSTRHTAVQTLTGVLVRHVEGLASTRTTTRSVMRAGHQMTIHRAPRHQQWRCSDRRGLCCGCGLGPDASCLYAPATTFDFEVEPQAQQSYIPSLTPDKGPPPARRIFSTRLSGRRCRSLQLVPCAQASAVTNFADAMAMGRVRGSDADTLRVDDSTDDGLRSPFAGTNGGLMHDGDDLLADDGASFPGIGDEGDSVEDPTVVLGPARPAQHQSDLKGKARDAALPAGQTPAGFADRELRFGGTMGMADRKANGDAPASVLTKVDSRTVEGERKFGDGDTGDGSPGDSAKHAALQRERDWLSGINDMLEKAADDFDTVKEKLLVRRHTLAWAHLARFSPFADSGCACRGFKRRPPARTVCLTSIRAS